MGFGVTIENNVKLEKAFNKIVKDGIINGLFAAANIVHAQAVQTSPILTGVLRLSHAMQVNEKELYAEVFIPENSPAAKYAPIVELTTPPLNPSNSGSRIPWLRPALYDNTEKCHATINDAVAKASK